MTTKITVSLPDEQVAALRAAVRDGEGRSVSALVSAALSDWTEKETLAQFLAHMEQVHGPIPAEDLAWARQGLAEARAAQEA